MQSQAHPLEPFFHEAVSANYENRLGLNDPAITEYVARMLCDFSEPENLYRLHDANGRQIESLHEMKYAADPVFGAAPSFDAERAIRKYMGDYSLFVAGMCIDSAALAETATPQPTIAQLIETGKESYRIVSQFNLFEYRKESGLFARLAENFERCVLGLVLIRQELDLRGNKAMRP
jgi:hypothetical protein